jgi:hypothetical protein
LKPLNVYRVRKINRANKLFGLLKYQVIISGTKNDLTVNYIKVRSWCLRTFGESLEYNLFQHRQKIGLDPVWSWDTENDQRFKLHIYLKDDHELKFFEDNFNSIVS